MSSQKQVLVCQHQSCVANGASDVLAAFLSNSVPACTIVASECQGQCNVAPTVRILPDGVWYCRVKADDVSTIATQHLQQDQPVQRLLHPRFHARYSSTS